MSKSDEFLDGDDKYFEARIALGEAAWLNEMSVSLLESDKYWLL